MSASRPTMRDVAERADVSLKTVSRVVNGEPNVRQETAERVLAAIDELGFRPNDLARSLRRGRTSATIGLVIGDVANPFYSTIARAAEERAASEGSLLITGSSDEDPERERDLVGRLITRRVDGLLVVPASSGHRWLAQEVHRGFPVVFLDRPGGDLEADTVMFDNPAGARAAVEHLVDTGHRRIAIIADAPDLFTVQERYAGYVEALGQAGLPLDEDLVRLGPNDTAGAERTMGELLTLSDPPDAVFATNNRMTLGVVRALWDMEERPGIVGFDDFELADLLGITVVAGDAAELGRRATDLLFDRLDGGAQPPRRIALPPRLLERGSARRGADRPRPFTPVRGASTERSNGNQAQ